MTNELYDIESVQVYGSISGPQQVLVLKLGVDRGDSPTDFKSFILNEWGAQVIMNSLASAGLKVTTGEDSENTAVVAADTTQ